MTLDIWLKQNTSKLSSAGIKSARLDGLILLERATKRDRSWLLANLGDEIPKSTISKLEKLISRRIKREPIAYIVGNKEFYGLNFKVTSDVLIPRPETEALVKEASSIVPKNSSVLELGTGSGCISVILKILRPDLDITATDISTSALNIAQINAKKHNVDIKFIQSDLFSNINSKYNLVLANLPYVPNGTRHEPELNFEPKEALFAGVDGLKFYRIFFFKLAQHLAPDGAALIEASATQFKDIKAIGSKHSYIINYITNYIILVEQQK